MAWPNFEGRLSLWGGKGEDVEGFVLISEERESFDRSVEGIYL